MPGSQRPGPAIVGLTGAPISSGLGGAGGKSDPKMGSELEITGQNAMQVLQSKGALLLQVGELPEGIAKKIVKLRLAATGRLPLAHLDAAKLPQIVEALQIKETPVVLLMAAGQVAAALEGDLSPQAATVFVERTAKLLGIQMSDLTEGVGDQLLEAEETEWTDAEAAEAGFVSVSEATDLSQEARIRAAAGRARCCIRLGRHEEAKAILDELEEAGIKKSGEVKQAFAVQWLDARRSETPLEDLKTAAEASPSDAAACEPYAISLFWSGLEGDAFDSAIAVVRKSKKSDEAKKLALALLEALGPRHPRFVKCRKSLNNALFA